MGEGVSNKHVTPRDNSLQCQPSQGPEGMIQASIKITGLFSGNLLSHMFEMWLFKQGGDSGGTSLFLLAVERC